MYFVKFGCKTEAATNSYIKIELCWILCYARVSENLRQIFLQYHFHRTDFTLEVSKVVASTSSRLIWLFNSYYFLNIFKLTWLFFLTKIIQKRYLGINCECLIHETSWSRHSIRFGNRGILFHAVHFIPNIKNTH